MRAAARGAEQRGLERVCVVGRREMGANSALSEESAATHQPKGLHVGHVHQGRSDTRRTLRTQTVAALHAQRAAAQAQQAGEPRRTPSEPPPTHRPARCHRKKPPRPRRRSALRHPATAKLSRASLESPSMLASTADPAAAWRGGGARGGRLQSAHEKCSSPPPPHSQRPAAKAASRPPSAKPTPTPPS